MRERRSTSTNDEILPPTPLDASARRAVQRFMRVMARGGCDPRAVLAEAEKACDQIPQEWYEQSDNRDAGDTSHVMTLWFSDPTCLDRTGNPSPLPLRGPAPSIEALVRRIDPKVDVQMTLRYLEQAGAVQSVGSKYLPRGRALIFRTRDDVVTALRGLFGLLKTLDYNSQRSPKTRKWLQLFARNPHFPISALPAFEAKLREWIHQVMTKVDSEMHLGERSRDPDEPTVRIGLGIYQFEEDARSEDSEDGQPSASRTTKAKRGRR